MEKLEDAEQICVDTDILIDFLRNQEPGSRAYERWRTKASISITAITVFELLIGARRSHQKEKRYDEAKSLIEQQDAILSFDKSAADRASEIGAELKRTGKEIEIRDLFNASICINQNLPILTRNKNHYQRVRGLALVEL